MITRRSFLQKTLGSSVALCLPALPRRLPRRPNVLFCIADDQSYPHASIYGCPFVETPAFDRVAREGVLFHNAFVSSPSCCPSRGSVLTGQDFYRLREASMNHTIWPGGLETYPDLLAAVGYHVGFTGKGWGPGNWRVSGQKQPPGGPPYQEHKLTPPGKYMAAVDYAGNFKAFLEARPAAAPFCFWAGFQEPHREYEAGIGKRHGKDPGKVQAPGFLPDVAVVREDILDYAFEIEHCDRHLGRILQTLEEAGELDNTLVVVTADNGMPFPRAKANLYDYGTRMPLAIRWGSRVKPGRVVDDFVSFTDFAPTFLETAGLQPGRQMTGTSLMPVLLSGKQGHVEAGRDQAVFGIERHYPGSRADGAGYPCRAVRTRDFLYIRNLTPDRNPCGDRPGPVYPADDPVGGFGDTDGGPTKTYLWQHRAELGALCDLSFGRRPAEEIYDIRRDPYNLRNLADAPEYAAAKRKLADRLDAHLKRTLDPRASGRGSELDAVMRRYPKLQAP